MPKAERQLILTSAKKFTRDIGTIGITNLLIHLKSIILLPILTKILGTQAYGLWTQIIVTLHLLQPIVTLGLTGAMTRFLAAEKERRIMQEGVYSIIFFVLFLSLATSFLLIIFSKPLALWLFDGRGEIVKLTALIIPPYCIDVVLLMFFRTFRQMKRYSLFIIFQTFSDLILISYSVLYGYGIWGVTISLLINRIALFLIMFGFVISKIGVKLPNFSRIKEYLSYSLPFVPANISSWIVTSSDRYIIGYFLGIFFVGLYSPGYALGSIISILIAPLAFVLLPTLSKSYDEGRIDEVKKYLRYSLKYFLMLALPSVFGLSILSRQILMMLSTHEIAVQGYIITPFVALSTLLYGVCTIFSQIIALVKKTKVIGIAWLSSALVNITLNVILIPQIGLIGAAVATLIAYSLSTTIIVSIASQYFTFDIEWSSIAKSIIACFVMSAAIWGISRVATSNLVILVMVGSGIYGIAFFLLKGLKEEEIKFFKGILGFQ